jgi:hypothetical protein
MIASIEINGTLTLFTTSLGDVMANRSNGAINLDLRKEMRSLLALIRSRLYQQLSRCLDDNF